MTAERDNGELRLSPIERRMMKVLEDGTLHTPQELHGCLNDDLGALSNIAAHLVSLRKKLRPHGRGVALQRFDGSSYYLLIRLTRKD